MTTKPFPFDLCDHFLKHEEAIICITECNKTSPVVCCGTAFRTAGARCCDELWRILKSGVDAIKEIPHDRWERSNEARINCAAYGGFISDIGKFDAAFFGISPSEAVNMDPQQRILLECVWEAFELANIVPSALHNSNTGVFIGVTNHDYSALKLKIEGEKHINCFHGTGTSFSICSGRISYLFGLQGPSISIDTACSSSLVSFHYGFQSVRRQEVDMAVVGGVNLMISPDVTIGFSKARMLSPDGRCKTFDEKANGYVRSEGCGIVLLKKTENAFQDKNNVLAIIRGTAVNQDGRSSGLTAPNGLAQQRLLEKALLESKLSPQQISYVEAHGTGTSLGDPIEVQAICAVYCSNRPESQPLLIGSIKTNIGHTESAAGVAGLIKIILSLQHQEIPGNLHFHKLNPHVLLDGNNVVISTENVPWFTGEAQKIAGVSSFGFSGTNAHTIISEPPKNRSLLILDKPRFSHNILLLSAKTAGSLHQMLSNTRRFFLDGVFPEHRDVLSIWNTVCRSLATKRTIHNGVRIALVASSVQQVTAYTQDALLNFHTIQTCSHSSSSLVLSCSPTPTEMTLQICLLLTFKSFMDFDNKNIICSDDMATLALVGAAGQSSYRTILPLLHSSFTKRKVCAFSENPLILLCPSAVGFLAKVCRKQKYAITLAPFRPQFSSPFGDWVNVLSVMKHLFQLGLNIRWETFFSWKYEIPASYPTYPFDKKTFWIQQRLYFSDLQILPDEAYLFQFPASLTFPIQILHHKVQRDLIFPAAGHIGVLLGLVRGNSKLASSSFTMKDVTFLTPIKFDEVEKKTSIIQYLFKEIAPSTFSFRIFSQQFAELHVTGQLHLISDEKQAFQKTTRHYVDRRISHAAVYEALTDCGFNYGESFRHIDWIGQAKDSWIFKTLPSTSSVLDAGLLDAFFQGCLAVAYFVFNQAATFIPYSVGALNVLQTCQPSFFLCEVISFAVRNNVLSCDLHVFDPEGNLIMLFEGISLVKATANSSKAISQKVAWKAHSFDSTSKTVDHVLVHSTTLFSQISNFFASTINITFLQKENLPAFLIDDSVVLYHAENHFAVWDHITNILQLCRTAVDENVNIKLWIITERSLIVNDPESILENRVCKQNFVMGGIARALSAEVSNALCCVLDFHSDAQIELMSRLIQHPTDAPKIYAVRNGAVYVEEVLEPISKQKNQLELPKHPFKLRMSANNSMSPVKLDVPNPDLLRVQVSAAGINFRDVANLLKLVDNLGELGLEYSGKVESGPRICGQNVFGVFQGSFASHVDVARASLKPPNIGHLAAATLPIAFLTVYHVFNLVSPKGKWLLVHAASGGVGLACLQVAKLMDATVIGSAGVVTKRYLVQACGACATVSSRNDDLITSEVNRITEGRGVDIVINSLTDKFLDKSIKLVKDGGTFIELGKVKILSQEEFSHYNKTGSYHHFDLMNVLANDLHYLFDLLDTVSDKIANSELIPLPRSVFSMVNAISALQFVQSAKHIGKVVLKNQKKRKNSIPIQSVLITGAFGGVGALFTNWMMKKWKNSDFILVGREGGKFVGKANSWHIKCDVTIASDVEKIRWCYRKPIQAIFHCAGVVKDATIFHISSQLYQEVIAPKVYGTRNLAKSFNGPSLKYFILFSSVSSLFGLPGQVNYAAANSFLDGYASFQRAIGLPCTSVNWGPFADLGMVSRMTAGGHNQLTKRFSGIPPKVAFSALEEILGWNVGPHVAVFLSSKTHQPLRVNSEVASKSPTEVIEADLDKLLAQQLALVLEIQDPTKLDFTKPLLELGMDSLTAVMFRNNLCNILSLKLPSTLAFDYPTLSSLSSYLKTLVNESPQKETPSHFPGAISQGDTSVIGFSCAFPGGSRTENIWSLLQRRQDFVDSIPEERSAIRLLESYQNTGGQHLKFGGFLQDVDKFDEAFFGISPVEAAAMDPQQRILLQLVWEALEHAMILPGSLTDSQTGVFIGITNFDYALLKMKDMDIENVNAYHATGNSFSIASGRISYSFGLKGPCTSIDTACSSSLVALHLACSSLITETNLCIVGGVNLLLAAETTIAYSRSRMLSPDGRCKTFDEKANGYVRSEGCGIVLLKKTENAFQDKNNVLAIIRGTAVNQDGKSSGLTAPNGPSQQTVLRRALHEGNIDPSLISYVEAHGTGTSLGDPIEVQAICAVYCSNRSESQPLLIGSIKTNIGHTESAAGVAGLIKIILSLQHQEIPGNLHFHKLNPHINLDNSALIISTQNTPWCPLPKHRFAAVSSFGFSGTNSHAVVSEYIGSNHTMHITPVTHRILILSAKSQFSLLKVVEKLSYFVRTPTQSSENVEYLCNSFNLFRGTAEFRAGFVFSKITDLTDKMQTCCDIHFHQSAPSLAVVLDCKLNFVSASLIGNLFQLLCSLVKQSESMLVVGTTSVFVQRQRINWEKMLEFLEFRQRPTGKRISPGIDQASRMLSQARKIPSTNIIFNLAAFPYQWRHPGAINVVNCADDWGRFLHCLLHAYNLGAQLELSGLVSQNWSPQGAKSILPSYCFQQKSHWYKSSSNSTPKRQFRHSEKSSLNISDKRSVIQVVQLLVRDILQLDKEPELYVPFVNLGFDSISALEFHSRISETLHLSLPPTLIFDYPTIDLLANFVLQSTQGTYSMTLEQTTAVNSSSSVAVVAMSCKYPLGANDPKTLWNIITKGKDCISNLSRKEQILYAGLLTTETEFDSSLFGISPREADAMDPQQRELLKHCWSALRQGQELSYTNLGRLGGVFIGASENYFHQTQPMDRYMITGSANSMCAGRMAFVFGLQGPAVCIDTACSSSLVATHLAIQSLKNSECSFALAGGVHIILQTEIFPILLETGMLSPDGRCKTFDEKANGYVRSEGCGIVLLKKTENAFQDKNNVLAIIRGTAVNQDGRSSGLTAPNGPSQQTVLRRALHEGNIDPSLISYVEAHGTGTSLGDPIEVQAICAVYCSNRSESQPLLIGSIKTNIGHAESAAGVAGLIKIILSLQHQKIPGNLHFHNLNPLIMLDNEPVVVPTETISWYSLTNPRFASVSSFGFSGTNSHAVVSESSQPQEQETQQRTIFICTISAHNSAAFNKEIRRLRKQILSDTPFNRTINTPEQYIQEVTTLQAHFTSSHRLAIAFENVKSLYRILKSLQTVKNTFESTHVSCSDSPQKRVFGNPTLLLWIPPRKEGIFHVILQCAFTKWIQELSLSIEIAVAGPKHTSQLNFQNGAILLTTGYAGLIPLIPRERTMMCCLREASDHSQLAAVVVHLYTSYPNLEWADFFGNAATRKIFAQ